VGQRNLRALWSIQAHPSPPLLRKAAQTVSEVGQGADRQTWGEDARLLAKGLLAHTRIDDLKVVM
jgi:hypothetical protein